MNLDSRQLLLGNLISCFQRQAQQIDSRWTTIIDELLPDTMTLDQARNLSRRLIIRYRFLPSIAEIVEEWRAMAREEYMKTSRPETGVKDTEKSRILHRLRKIRQEAAAGNRFPEPEVDPEVTMFARLFYPEISDTLIQRNWLEITNCMQHRQQQEREHSPYRTVMHLCQDGSIELRMRRISP
ncbi:hypothetical protein NXG27_09575 [Megasphaera paucivorans]|nr:hypothetical protein [Megasphaera paucivorans]